MNVNDIICVGAEPIALVDYLALERAQPGLVNQIMRGLQRGAQEAGVAIVSGETAIVPDLVRSFDLSATVVGLVRKDKIITGDKARPSDVVLGLRSSGIHSNGLTLARKLMLTPRTNRRVARELLRPTRIYVKPVTRLLKSGVTVRGFAHITGGAYSKLKRIGVRANVGFNLNKLPDPPKVFKNIQAKGGISPREMYRTFNMGIGLLVICPKLAAERAARLVPDLLQVGNVTDSREVTISVDGKKLPIENY